MTENSKGSNQQWTVLFTEVSKSVLQLADFVRIFVPGDTHNKKRIQTTQGTILIGAVDYYCVYQ